MGMAAAVFLQHDGPDTTGTFGTRRMPVGQRLLASHCAGRKRRGKSLLACWPLGRLGVMMQSFAALIRQGNKLPGKPLCTTCNTLMKSMRQRWQLATVWWYELD